MARGKTWLWRGLLALLLLAGTLALLELGLRALQAWRPVWFLPNSDRLLTFHGRPGELFYADRLNARGYNDDDFRPEKPPRSFRIAGLADSFGFGVVPREHNVFTRLERRLAAGGRAVEVCNLSVVCIGPAEYLRLLRDEALALQPDLVVCLFYVGNDFTDGELAADTTLPYRDRLWRLAAGMRQGDRAAIGRYREASYALALLDFLLLAPQARLVAATYHDTAPTLAPALYRQVRAEESALFRRDGELARLAARSADRLAEMRDLARAAGAGFMAVIAPQELQVYPDRQRELHGDTTDYDYAAPNRGLGDMLRARGVACLDLLPAFRAAGMTTQLYKPQDTHWNIAGNALAAELIAARLAEEYPGLRAPAGGGE